MHSLPPTLPRRALKPCSLAICMVGALGLSSTPAFAVGEFTDIGTLPFYVNGKEVEGGAGPTAISLGGDTIAGTASYIWVSGWPPNPYVIENAFRWTPTTGMISLGGLGGTNSRASAMSSDGGVIVGRAQNATGRYRAFRWTTATGMVDLGTLGGGYSEAYAVNADGRVVVGGASTALNEYHAFRWIPTTGMLDLGSLGNGYSGSRALAVTPVGDVIVGTAWNANYDDRAFRWTAATGMIDLGTLGGRWSRGGHVSRDGTVVVGYAQSPESIYQSYGYEHAFRWTAATGMVDLGTLGGDRSIPSDISADGSVVVGWSATTYGQNHAFRWTPATGMHTLGTLGGTASSADAVSADGNAIVGDALDASNMQHAFRWTQATGMQSVENWLTDNGVAVGAVTPGTATATDFDGNIVTGTLSNGHAYIARVGEYGSGLTTPEDISDSLASTSQAVDATLTTAGTLIHGAHSRPLSRRVAADKKTAWLAGDWGRDDHGQHEGSIGLAELGYGYNFGPAQLNFAIGKTWSNQAIVHGGDIDADGQYMIAEAIVPMDETRGLYATLGAYGHWGDADIDRGYLNAGLPDYSNGDPDTRTWGVRARVDWENAFILSRTAFSPYADISYVDARMDGYTETGGGFPAHFDKREQNVTELRAGVNGALPLSSSTTQLVLNLEAAHRFDAEGTRTSGEMLGLFGFDLDGREYDQTWARGGIGVEGQLGQGKASLMLNGTTRGEMPNVWLAASYQVAF